jgi:sec-independent protein translocase protein TatC
MRSRRHNPDGTMSLRDHLYELRYRIGLAILFILFGGIFGFIWFQTNLGPVPSLGKLLTGPYCALPADQRVSFNGGECRLLQTKPFEAFLIQFKVGIAAGMVVTSPLWLYQIWKFITPGLYDRERRFALTFVLCASALFAAGAVVAYLVVPQGLKVLVSFGGDQFATALAANDYVSFVLVLLLIFGVSFELPLVVIMLNWIGVLPYRNLAKWRRGIIFALFVFAAFATPGTDPISMVSLAAAMTVLFELAVQVSRVHDKRKARRQATEFAEHPEDDPSVPSPGVTSSAPTSQELDDVT